MSDGEQKAEDPRRRIARESDDVGMRLRLFEERTENRLRAGAETMSAMRTQIEELKPKPRSVWPFITGGCAVIVALMGWVWQASRYPERPEFEQNRVEMNQRFDAINTKLLNILLEQERVRGSLERIEKAAK